MRNDERHAGFEPDDGPETDEEVARPHAAAGDVAGRRGQLDAAGGGYGSNSGSGTSGGTGDGEPGATGSADERMDDGTSSGGTGATGEGPTEWLRSG